MLRKAAIAKQQRLNIRGVRDIQSKQACTCAKGFNTRLRNKRDVSQCLEGGCAARPGQHSVARIAKVGRHGGPHVAKANKANGFGCGEC